MNNQIFFSFDDGGSRDLQLAGLLNKYGFKATFYIPNFCSLMDDQIKYLSEYHEIGGHTVNHHPKMSLLSPETVYLEIKENKDWLENIIGKEITKFAYPRGRYSDMIIKQVKKAGFKEARGTMVGCVNKPIDLYKIKTTCHIYNKRKEYGTAGWQHYFWRLWGSGDYYHIWGHSSEIMRYNIWGELEEFLKKLKQKTDEK